MNGNSMDRGYCLHLLAQHNVGRVAFSERALPTMRPVGYTLVGALVVLRATTKALARQLDGQVVAFEVDEIDDIQASGWSVLVTGTAHLLRQASESVVITPAAITGRWLPAAG